MKLGRVVGTVVSTINVPVFDERKLLVCDLLDPEGAAAGGYLIAVDTVGAGPGETVLLLDEGNSARQVLGAPEAPVRTLVVGIVDDVQLERPRVARPHATAPARRAPRRGGGTAPASPAPASPAPASPAGRRARRRTPRAGA